MATMTMDGMARPMGRAMVRSAGRTSTRTAVPRGVRSVARPAAASAGAVRLTRRGRLVVFLALVTAAMAVASLGLAALRTPSVAALTTQSAAAPAYHRVVVHAGDTLWSIAGRTMPGVDPVEAIGRIRALNAMQPSTPLVAGAVIAVPTV